VRIHDEAGRAQPPGEVGEIYLWLGGWPDFTYHKLDDKRREIERDGLVSVGDVGYLDEEGYLFLCDRKRDMVISGGVNIYPAEIESVLHAVPGVHDCAVFGIPDAEFGEALMAVVEPQPGITLDASDVRARLKTSLADYKVPKHIEIRSGLPREDSGKIFKRRLRDPYWEQAGRKI
jgi:long-chain acyl-CoA synthetase